MTQDEALKILQDVDAYIDTNTYGKTVVLDGNFTKQELEAVLTYHFNKAGEVIRE